MRQGFIISPMTTISSMCVGQTYACTPDFQIYFDFISCSRFPNRQIPLIKLNKVMFVGQVLCFFFFFLFSFSCSFIIQFNSTGYINIRGIGRVTAGYGPFMGLIKA